VSTATLYEHAEHIGAPLPAATVAHLDAEAEVYRQIDLSAKLDAAFGPADWGWQVAPR